MVRSRKTQEINRQITMGEKIFFAVLGLVS